MEAQAISLHYFKAYNGLIQRFLRRSPIQPPYKLREKGGYLMPFGQVQRMKDLEDIAVM